MTITNNTKLTCGEDNDGWYLERGASQIAYGLRHEQARRIVACINACVGFGTESLERYHNERKPENGFGLHRQDKLEAQRDEMLAALKMIAFATAPYPEDGSYHENAYHIATQAIEKHEAGL